MKRASKKVARKIAYRDGELATEPGLPLEVVHYPGHYGAFFGFSEKEGSPIFLCACSRVAVENYVHYRLDDVNRKYNSDLANAFLLSNMYFPQRLVDELMQSGAQEDKGIVEKIRFREDLCHECNKKTPSLGYCVSMYGGTFEQNYGWYINKQSFGFGVVPISYKIISDVCRNEVFEACGLEKDMFIMRYMDLSEKELVLASVRSKEFRNHARMLRNVIENEVRARFGFKRVGEAWANETLLYQLVSEVLPDKKIIRHYRPEFLERLELDIFIPEIQVGIEYQGIQHFQAVEHWGGREALERTKARDTRKKDLCNANGIRLIYFFHTESLSIDLVIEKLMH